MLKIIGTIRKKSEWINVNHFLRNICKNITPDHILKLPSNGQMFRRNDQNVWNVEVIVNEEQVNARRDCDFIVVMKDYTDLARV